METKLNLCIALSTLFFGKAFAEDVVINDAFTDVDFRTYISQSFDSDGDGILSEAECASVHKINVRNVLRGASIDGLGNFPNLESLDCSGNYLDEVDFSKNPSFHYLCCNENYFRTLDLSSAPLLDTLIFCGGSASTIDLRNNPNVTYVGIGFSGIGKLSFGPDSKLITLDANDGSLSNLDVSGCGQLKELYLSDCSNLKKLDLSNNSKLKKLYCGNNQLTELDLSHNPELEILSCSNNSNIPIKNTISSLDLSHNPKLKKLYCSNNQLMSLDLSQNPELETLNCEGNLLKMLDLSQSAKLKELKCAGNPLVGMNLNSSVNLTSKDFELGEIPPIDTANITSISIKNAFPDEGFSSYVSDILDKDKNGVLSEEECASVTEINVSKYEVFSLEGIENFPNLERLNCSNSYLDEIDLSHNPSVRYLSCNQCDFDMLDLSLAPSLDSFVFCGGAASTVNLRNNSNLTYVSISFTSVTNLYFGANSQLVKLDCDNASIRNLDVSGCGQLEEVNFNYCLDLVKLDLSHSPKLKKLYCEDSQITKLDLSGSPELEILSCSNNYDNSFVRQFSSLDLSHNPKLKKLYCSNNQLMSLDLSQNPEIEIIECDDNKLTSLNLSHCPKLTNLNCSDNHLSSLYLNPSAMLKTLKCDNNSYDVESDGNGQIDVTTLPDSFDVTKVSNLVGASLEGNILTVDPESDVITYDYAAGSNKASFIINVSRSAAEIDLTNVMEVVESSYSIQSVDGAIVIENAENHYAEVFSVDGRMVFADYLTDVRQSISVADGCYLVKIGEVTTKVIVR